MRGDIVRWMKEDQRRDAWFTTMFDLYRLPPGFPGLNKLTMTNDPYEKIGALETAFKNDVCEADGRFWRFIPHLQLHEFEALLFSDPTQFNWQFIEDRHERGIEELVKISRHYGNPELIDDGAETAPSKRIIRWIPEYKGRKSSAGPLIADKIGLQLIRKSCSHFDSWLKQLEALAQQEMTQ